MKVFGIGLSRTGTASLNKALNLLSIPAYHFPRDRRTCVELMSGQYRLSVLDRFDAITDITASAFYEQFDAEYPGSRFVLTVREKGEWLKSVGRHFKRAWRLPITADPGIPGRDVGSGKDYSFRIGFGNYIDYCVYGLSVFNERRFSEVYDRHVRNVRDYFEDSGRLLVLDVCGGDGWEKLCPFLDKDVPECPFPRLNAWVG